MAEQNGNGADTPQAGPKFSVLAQYTKDFSFENPNAPRTLGPQQTPPNISIQINVNARQLAASDYEVSLMLEGGAGQGADTMFKFELNYAGRISGGELSGRAGSAGGHDRGPANPVPVRAANRRGRGAWRVLSAALYRPDRFSGALSAEIGGSWRSIAATDRLIFRRDQVTRLRHVAKPNRVAAETFNIANVCVLFRVLDQRYPRRPSDLSGEQPRQRVRRLLPAASPNRSER